MASTAVRLLAFLGLLLPLAGCAGKPEGLMLPAAAEAEGASVVDMLVVTTRQETADRGKLFTGERARNVSFAEIEISIPPDSKRKIGEVQWPKVGPGDPSKEFATRSARILKPDEVVADLSSDLDANGRGEVLVFVHGYNNRFEDAVFTFAQFVHDSGASGVPILYTWPSRGEVLEYGYDRESANYSRDALEVLLERLAATPKVKDISIIAHSMGNWVAVEALRQAAIRNGKISPKIRNVVLASPDVDVDVFRSQMRAIGTGGPRFTILASRDDRALAISRRLWGNTDRLGAIDPTAEPYATDLDREGIQVIDLTEVKTEGLNHSKFAEAPEVVRLIGTRLAAGQRLDSGSGGLSQRITMLASDGGAAIGSVIGNVVVSPLTIAGGGAGGNRGGKNGDVPICEEGLVPGPDGNCIPPTPASAASAAASPGPALAE